MRRLRELSNDQTMTANRLSLASLMLTTALLFSHCSKEKADPPVAGFSFSGTNMAAPSKITFTNSSINAVSYAWNFGDGTTSYDENPTHIFQTGGTYMVTLEAVGGPNAGTTKTTKTITIQNRYTTAKVTYVKILAIPATKANGASWENDGVDLFFKITDASNQVYVDATDNRFNNVTALPVQWNFQAPYFSITPLSAIRSFDIWEYNSVSPNEKVGSIAFSPAAFQAGNPDNPYPNKWNITYQGLSLEIGLQWQ